MTDSHTSRVSLIAHASTDAVRQARFPDDEPLDRYGVAEARERAHPTTRAARCSPTRRCTETAVALGLRAAEDPELTPWELGSWRGRRLDELSASEPDAVMAWLHDPDSAPHGGESLTRLIDRVGGWLEATTSAGRLVVVTDPALIRAALAHALPGGWQTFWRIDVGPLAHVELRRAGATWSLTALDTVPRSAGMIR